MSLNPLQTSGERRQRRLPISASGSEDFIASHQLVPISELQGLMVSSHPERDCAALCSNCHSMIHRIKVVHDIEALRAQPR
jgi:predicted HNH restriction endonuclease